MIMDTFKQTVRRYVPSRLRSGLLSVKAGGKSFPSNAEITEFHRRLHGFPEGSETNSAQWSNRLLGLFYQKGNANALLPAADVSCAESWVPFRKNQTRLLIYNFFEKNYGIREPMLFRVVVFAAGATPVSSHQFLLAGSEQILLSDFPGAELPNDGTVLVQAIHPRAKTKGNQLRYFVFYGEQGEPTNVNCGLHSLALPDHRLLRPLPFGFRNVAPLKGDHGQTIASSVTQPRVSLQKRANGHTQSGLEEVDPVHPVESQVLFFRENAAGVPLGVWHDGQTSHDARPASAPQAFGRGKTGFFVPDFKHNAPIVSVTPSQIGFQVGKLRISVASTQGEFAGKIIAENEAVVERGTAFLDLAEMFSNREISGPVGVTFEFDRDMGEFAEPPNLYVHLYYRGSGVIGDQVHSHFSQGRFNAPFPKDRSYRCLKFAPFIKDSNLDFFYSVHNIGGRGSNPDEELFVRIITDTGFEKRFKVAAPADRITSISHRDLFQGIESEVRQTAIVQYEHGTTNFNGSWHFINRRTGAMGTDHFTGG